MTVELTGTSLRERAAAELADFRRCRETEDTEARLKARLENEALLERLMGRVIGVSRAAYSVHTWQDRAVARVDGLEFLAFAGHYNSEFGRTPDGLHLLGTCPTCGATCWSGQLDSTVGLALQLEQFMPHYGHEHEWPDGNPSVPAPPPEPAPAETLESLIRRIVRDEVQRGDLPHPGPWYRAESLS